MKAELIEKKIMNLIMKYGEEHEMALECGAEYIYQSDEAQIDALELVADIFEVISVNKEN